jgi:glycosyltransferase involved in cell wall biosynthesis
MRILLVHNKYQQYGGEDVAVELEYELLQQKGNETAMLIFSNNSLTSIKGKAKGILDAFHNKKSAKVLSEKIKNFKPDIIHVHNIFFNASPSIFRVCKKMKIPVVLTFHNYRYICANALLLRNNKPCELCVNKIFPLSGVVNKCYRNSALQSTLVTAITGYNKVNGLWRNYIDRYISLTKFSQQKIMNSSLSLQAEKIKIIPNYIPDTGIGNVERENFYLFVGRLSVEKGIETLLEAFSSANYKIYVAGDGVQKNFYQDKYSKFKNIQFTGKLEKAAVMALMKRAKAIVFPSICYENLPYTILEAFSTGTPVIASRHGGMLEMVTDGYNGYHFTAGDKEDLLHVINKFENTAHVAMYEHARKTYLSNYNSDAHYKSLVNLFNELITDK